MEIEQGDCLQLFDCQVHGAYLHEGVGWFCHSARGGHYTVLEIEGQGVLLGIKRTVKPGMDIFRCCLDHIHAILLPEFHKKRTMIYEDQLPPDYPYSEMFPYSRVIDGVRMFPSVTHEWRPYAHEHDRRPTADPPGLPGAADCSVQGLEVPACAEQDVPADH